MATRTIEGTLDTLSVDTGSEITYLGATSIIQTIINQNKNKIMQYVNE